MDIKRTGNLPTGTVRSELGAGAGSEEGVVQTHRSETGNVFSGSKGCVWGHAVPREAEKARVWILAQSRGTLFVQRAYKGHQRLFNMAGTIPRVRFHHHGRDWKIQAWKAGNQLGSCRLMASNGAQEPQLKKGEGKSDGRRDA